MTDEEWIKTIPSLSATALLEDLDYCGYDSYYRTIREPVVAEIKKRLERTETLEKENKELREKVHFWKKEVRVTERARDDEFDKILIENRALKKRITDLEATNKRISDECHKLVDSLKQKQKEITDLKERLAISEQDRELISAAKDLLKRWVDDRVYTVSEQKDLIADTEQFLEEE